MAGPVNTRDLQVMAGRTSAGRPKAFKVNDDGTLPIALALGGDVNFDTTPISSRLDTANTALTNLIAAVEAGGANSDVVTALETLQAALTDPDRATLLDAGQLDTIIAALTSVRTDNADRLTALADAVTALSDTLAAGIGTTGSLTNAELRAAPVDVTGPLTNTQLRATAVPVTGPATDAQLRATPLAVNTGGLTNAELRGEAVTVTIDGLLTRLQTIADAITGVLGISGTVSISNTSLAALENITAIVSALPAGYDTAVLNKLDAVITALGGISVTLPDEFPAPATEAKLDDVIAAIGGISLTMPDDFPDDAGTAKSEEVRALLAARLPAALASGGLKVTETTPLDISALAKTADAQAIRDRLPAAFSGAGGVKVTETNPLDISGLATAAGVTTANAHLTDVVTGLTAITALLGGTLGIAGTVNLSATDRGKLDAAATPATQAISAAALPLPAGAAAATDVQAVRDRLPAAFSAGGGIKTTETNPITSVELGATTVTALTSGGALTNAQLRASAPKVDARGDVTVTTNTLSNAQQTFTVAPYGDGEILRIMAFKPAGSLTGLSLTFTVDVSYDSAASWVSVGNPNGPQILASSSSPPIAFTTTNPASITPLSAGTWLGTDTAVMIPAGVTNIRVRGTTTSATAVTISVYQQRYVNIAAANVIPVSIQALGSATGVGSTVPISGTVSTQPVSGTTGYYTTQDALSNASADYSNTLATTGSVNGTAHGHTGFGRYLYTITCDVAGVIFKIQVSLDSGTTWFDYQTWTSAANSGTVIEVPAFGGATSAGRSRVTISNNTGSSAAIKVHSEGRYQR